MATDEQQRKELGAFLRARREKLDRAGFGLPPAGRGRTVGLRREEISFLSGVSVTWYTWLEQGRDINPSRQVLDAVATTLHLTVAEHDYVTVDVGVDGQLSFAGMDLEGYIAELEAKMKDAAANLEFEEAARLRDEIRRLEAAELGVKMAPTARTPARAEHQRLKTEQTRARAKRQARARRQRAASGRR